MASAFLALLIAPAAMASPSNFLAQRPKTCQVGKVMAKVLNYPTQTFGNERADARAVVADGLLDNQVDPSVSMIPFYGRTYGSNETFIDNSEKHCTEQSNDYTEADFKEAWGYLGCELRRLLKNPVVASQFEASIMGLEPIVQDAGNPPASYPNPWIGATPEDFVQFFEEYFWFLPEPNGTKTGLVYIIKENFFERKNPAAIHFLNTFKSMTAPADKYTTEIFDWTYQWVTARGLLMDSAYSKRVIGNWVAFNDAPAQTGNTNVDMSAYQHFDPSDNEGDAPGYGYNSFNQFFSRQFKNLSLSRPVSQPDADMLVTAPGDVEINFIYAKLTADTKIPVKDINAFNINELLAGSSYASRFVGGTAVSCVLMPYAYHNFHAPVDGQLIEAVDVPGTLFGIPDGTAWFGSGNTGTSTTNFNIFGGFHRAYMLYDTGKYGLVAQISVGLADVSTICGSVGSHVGWVAPGSCCCEGSTEPGCDSKPTCQQIQRGEHVGYFAYGGSLNILLFEGGAFSSMNVLMGNRIGGLSEPAIKA